MIAAENPTGRHPASALIRFWPIVRRPLTKAAIRSSASQHVPATAWSPVQLSRSGR